MANIPPLLQTFVEGELGRSADLIARTLTGVQEQLRRPGDSLLSAAERQHHFELAQALAQHSVLFQRRFVDTLRDAVVAELDHAAPEHAADSPAPSGLGGLQLMDESRVETEIELSRAIQEIDTAAEWELRELQTFTSTLRGQDHTTAESNPLRPRAYANALSEAAHALPLPPVQRALLVRVAATVMAPVLKMAWAAASTRLESQGITPSIYRTVVFAPGVGKRPTFNVTQPGALDAARRAMPEGTDSGASPDGLEHALGRFEQLLSRMAGSPSSAGSPGATPKLLEHRAALLANTGTTVDRQIIELIARLFEIIVSDPGLNPVVRSQLGRLQVSALRIALNDPEMLDNHDHPVWLLMARLVNAASAYPHPADTRLVALLTFSDELITQLTGEPGQDAARYRKSLGQLDQFLDAQWRQQQDQARRPIETLLRAEQTEQLQQQLSGRLAEQLSTVHATPVIRRFMTGTWAQVLARTMVTHGDAAEPTVGFVKAVDDLVWSLNLPDHPQSRQRLLALLPGLLQRLRAGMALVEMPAAEQQAVLDDLVAAHTEALRPGGRPDAAPVPVADASPEEIMRRLREETIEPPAASGAFSDSLIDLASMDTVPAALMSDDDDDGEDPGDWVNRLAPGTRQRIFLNGRWSQLQLLWRSPGGTYFLFAGESAGRTHSVTQRALERLKHAELAETLDPASLIERALDALLKKI